MDHIDWQILKVLQQEKSMLKASEQLFISQPAISYRLSRMESEFGQSLFIRSNRGIEMTSAGLRLYSFANLMLQYNDDIHHAVSNAGSLLTGSITVGTTESMLEYSLIPQIKSFNDSYPNIKVNITVASTPTLLKMVQDGELMMCTVRGSAPKTGNNVNIFDEPLIIVASEPITDEMLHTRPMIRNLPGTSVVTLIDEWVADYFDTAPILSPIKLIGSSRSVVGLVKTGLGWGVISASRYNNSTDELYWKTIYHSDGRPYRYNNYLHYTDEAKRFDTYMAYAEHLVDYFHSLAPSF